ncbi:LacI family transcriptional regulator [Arsenicitalea aurantiaca]|uniref:LacI family transcriptional regulator n=1 Tax=Arsenicitalea aurantiaca TaxID=1783274 RepID=A0A433XL64_9HYPH|nr:LacI family DNA-binding transcriptional regulator [Arsenicitalea aurantiaca]RUT34827.1 LacI family transcriptional regulator [Arsenicitalea aurantiaca]
MATPTIRSVAELAGVSTATVSRALTHPEKLRPDTRRRVLEAVERLGFVPNRQAVDFRRQATKTVILLVRDITNPFYLDIYKGVEEFAFEAGYKVLMGDARYDDARIAHYVDMVRNKQADGLIVMTGWIPEALRQSLPPIVIALQMIADLDLPMVHIDNAAAARLAVEHLIGLGHTRIVNLTGPMHEMIDLERNRGYREALEAAGLPFDPALEIAGNFRLASGQAAMRDLLASGIPFSAIFSNSDEMAVGAITELHASGRRVPEDVSVVGFDDTVFASAVDPGLTTIRQPQHEIGRSAMRMLIGILEDRPAAPGRIELPVELMVRGTTAPAITAPARLRAQ